MLHCWWGDMERLAAAWASFRGVQKLIKISGLVTVLAQLPEP